MEGVLEPTKTSSYTLHIPSYTVSHIPILNLTSHESNKTLNVKNCLVGGNKAHLKHIGDKVNAWINIMRNGNLPSSMG